MKRFINDFKHYYGFSLRSAKSTLKAEVAGSYLNWLWWILNPISFMFIYWFIFGVVFNAKEDYFSLYIFIGLTMWDFFNHTVTHSVKMIKNSKPFITKVYLPKFILIVSDMLVNGFKMLLSFGIVVLMMILQGVPFHWTVFFIIPVLLGLFLFTYAIAAFVMHFGVYVQDLPNVVSIVLRLLMYMTGIFYNIETRVPAPYNEWVHRLNPLANLMIEARDCILYGKVSHLVMYAVGLLVSLLLAVIATRLIYKNENSYVKVI